MAKKYQFKQAQRHAVYTAHNEKCYICGDMLTMQTVQIDHVIPESIADKAATLQAACNQLGRPEDFDVNSYENWLPACGRCNLQKRETVWKPSLQVQSALQQANDRADKARFIESELTSDRRLADAISKVLAAVEGDALTPEMLESLAPLVAFQAQNREDELAEEPIRFAPFLEVDRYRFDTRANLPRVPGTDDMIDMGNEFFIHGRRLTEFLVKFSFKPTTDKRKRYLHADVYMERPEYEGDPNSPMANGSTLAVLSLWHTVTSEVGGYEVTLQSYRQQVGALWVVLSTS